MNREYKSFEFKLNALDPTGRTIEGYAAVFGNLDQGGDIIHPGAFAKTLAERGHKVKFLWQHDQHEPLGRVTELREDASGLFVKATISDTARGRDALALLRDGAIGGMSIGYDAVKGGTDYSQGSNGDPIRNLRELKLWELSLVTFPMNEEAGVTALKMVTPHRALPIADRARPWDAPAANARVRDWAGAAEAPNAKYASAFLWHDAEAADQFGSYKLQFADVVDGELTMVPRAVFAVAQRLDSADIPDADKARIRGVVSQYYADMRRAFEDESIVAPWDMAKGGFVGYSVQSGDGGERERIATCSATIVKDYNLIVKSGRVISKANGARIMAALDNLKNAAEALEGLLESAGIGGDDEEMPAEDMPPDEEMACGTRKPKNADTAPAQKAGRDSTAETTGAGPLSTVPTQAERARLLAEINLYEHLGGA